MPSEAPATAVRPGEVTLQEIDDLLDQVARLARSESAPREFHLELLERAVRALAAVGGIVWTRSEAGVVTLDCRVDLTRDRSVEILSSEPAHREFLAGTFEHPQSRVVLPRAASTTGAMLNPTEFLLLVCPMSIGEEGAVTGILELAQRPGGSPAAQQGSLRLLEALSELAADYHRQRRHRILQATAQRSDQIQQFSLRVHDSLELDATCSTIANEGRRLIDCDRLSVAVRRGNSLQLLAVSGLEALDRRANIVRLLEDLSRVVTAAGEAFWFSGETENVPPQIAGPLHAWQDESHARSLAIIPLPAAPIADQPTDRGSGAKLPPSLGALVIERFGGERMDDACQTRIGLVASHARRALQNALDYESFPFFRVLAPLKKWRWFAAARRLPKTAAVLAGALAVIVALVYVPADFEIEGRGTLQPRNRRNVFARSDGIVAEVRTDHAQECREGDILAVMTKSQLDFESSRVQGELQTARKRLASVQASRLELSPQTAADREKYYQLTAEEEEVQELLNSLTEQNAVLKEQRDDLLVRSPLTGQVITWNVRQLLEGRPVQRGQVLLQVADLTGPWVLEIEVPDDRIGHVLDAERELKPGLDVSFMLATEPGVSYRGTIEKVAMSTDVRPPEKANVLVTVRIDREQIPRLRPGATAASHIHCGRRSIGYVWFHTLWETIQKKVLF
jgi:multidrug efflux pump subunit AcrA (membrane-fusion protein)